VTPLWSKGALGASFFILSCHGGSSDADREFERLSHLIRRLRDAPNADKGLELVPLRQSRCEHHCRLKALCLNAYERHHGALLRIAEVRRLMQDPGGEERARLSLQQAETESKLALEETRRCASTEAELSRAAQP
jgi:hypothetical protein